MHSVSERVFETRCLSSLSKVFSDVELTDVPVTSGSALRKEIYSFQVAFRCTRQMKGIRVNVNAANVGRVQARVVGLVPSELPCYHDHDEHILRATPGLYPDPLYPIGERHQVVAFPKQWRSVWITVEVPENAPAGRYPIDVEFHLEQGELLGRETFSLEVIPVALPDQTLIHTEWFYTDCLATWYGVDVFSDQHWKWIDIYLENAVKHGMNMVLTPIFTPPLETEVGHERPSVQLVDVKKQGDQYTFNFDKLAKWVHLCQQRGIHYFEMAHLFTQWGAKHAPKIFAEIDGEQVQIFGWDTDALGADYKNFLGQFLPALKQFIQDHGLGDHVYFHISDEPSIDVLEHFKNVSEFVKSFIPDFPVIDALSDYEFYATGAVPNPIPSNDHVTHFLEHQVQDLWTYYCCAQYKAVSNRFFNLPSARNRIIGPQLYKFHIKGFLHWGYNHWYSQKSLFAINPFLNTDAGYAFPSGDAFLVYPGADGPIDSIRAEVFYEALQDLRALQLLESLVGREQTLQLLESGIDEPITFTDYPRDLHWTLSMRERINQSIRNFQPSPCTP